MSEAVNEQYGIKSPIHLLSNYINGELLAPINGAYLNNIHPATGRVYGQIPDSNSADLERAVNAGTQAFNQWSALPSNERSKHMLRLAEAMEADIDNLAAIESFDNGKPLHVARNVDIPRAIQNIRFFATAILHSSSESHDMDGIALNYTLRQPIGLVACISPWNLPLYLFTWKIAPALAAGNTVIAKPSELTPATAFRFSELCIQAGIPPGVLNILHGTGLGIGEPLTSHAKIKAISFTGGTSTGARIASIVGPQFKKMSLELGGKNATLVFADCDFENTVGETVRAAFSNQGQICLCGSRILIEKSIFDKFKSAFVTRVKQLRVGPPNEAFDMGALVSEAHLNKVLSYIQLAKQEGGTILAGGNQIFPDGEFKDGFYLEPTVIEGLDAYCRVNQEEIFGPVVTLIPFETEEDAIRFANSTPYGLASSVWTTHVTKAHRVARLLQTGIVWVNCWMLRDLRTPFGGVKQSGVGREGGWEALRFFTEAKNVCIKL